MLIILVEGSKNIILDEMYDSHKVPQIGTKPLAGTSERAKITLCGRLETSHFLLNKAQQYSNRATSLWFACKTRCL